MHQWDPLSYIPPEESHAIHSPDRIVTYVHFVAHAVLQTGGNHWDIFLQTGEDQSVRLEMSPGAFPGQEGYLGRLDIILLNYALTRNSHKTVTIPAIPGHSVADFLSAIVRADNHRYEFTREGRGCTGWIRDQFYLFVQFGLLLPGWEEEFEAAINGAWNRGTLIASRSATYGTYLRDRGRGRRSGGARRR